MAETFSRRRFLVSLARLAALGGFGAAAARLLRGRPSLDGSSRPGETCTNEGVCRGCAVFAGCGLPAALSARQRAPWAGGGG